MSGPDGDADSELGAKCLRTIQRCSEYDIAKQQEGRSTYYGVALIIQLRTLCKGRRQ